MADTFEVTEQDFQRAFNSAVTRMRSEFSAAQWDALVAAGVHHVLELQAEVAAAHEAQCRFLDNTVHRMTFR